MTRPRTGARPRWLIPTVSVVAVALVAIGGIGAVTAFAPHGQETMDLRGNQVRPDPGTTPDAETLKSMRPSDTGAGRFLVPSVGLDVPLGSLTVVNNTITPPGFTSAYRLRNKGTSTQHPAAGTVFVVMHSLRGGGVGPGNYLINVEAGTARVQNGTKIEVDDVDYVVSGSQTITKTELANRADLWADAPGRLIVITCLQTPSGRASVNNMVITATLVQ